jgi:hypothetical protein
VKEPPEHQAHFVQWMALRQKGIGAWTYVLDWEPDVIGSSTVNTTNGNTAVAGSSTTDNDVLFVDVGGAMGHQWMTIRGIMVARLGRKKNTRL